MFPFLFSFTLFFILYSYSYLRRPILGNTNQLASPKSPLCSPATATSRLLLACFSPPICLVTQPATSYRFLSPVADQSKTYRLPLISPHFTSLQVKTSLHSLARRPDRTILANLCPPDPPHFCKGDAKTLKFLYIYYLFSLTLHTAAMQARIRPTAFAHFKIQQQTPLSSLP